MNTHSTREIWKIFEFYQGARQVSTPYTLSTKDPTFAGIAQSAEIENSWSRGMIRKVYLSPSGICVILVHPWLARDQRAFEDAWRYKEKYNAQTVIVGTLEEQEKRGE
jgi:hypothetical protein